MIFALTNLLINLGLARKYARRGAYGVLLLAVAVLMFVFLIGIKSCYTNRQINKTQNEINEIRQEQSNATVTKDAVTIEAKEKEAETAKAKAEREAVIKKLDEARKSDSANEKADAWAALDRFCSVYKDDSACSRK